MTSFIRLKTITTNQRRSFRRGFTLVEMLVVVGIIVVLVGILLPAINKVHTRAIRGRMQLDIQTLVAAMESYKADMRDYPHIDYTDAALVSTAGPPGGLAPAASNPGAVTLCTALVGPGGLNIDGYGATGITSGTNIPMGSPGFTIRPQGQVYGPYIDVSRFKFITDPTMDPTQTNAAGNHESNLCLADRYSHPILYYKANTNAAYTSASTTITGGGFAADVGPGSGSYPYYNYQDNPVAFRWPNEANNSLSLLRFQMMLGDKDHSGMIDTASKADGLPEIPNSTASYLIWSAGPDELFGFDVTDPQSGPNTVGNISGVFRNVSTSDDATNFSY
ncbi:MAG TPA: prepilin-type N-terminal cleavage/methylation domain-containing protein [Tepidisphaeraceae bacterium]|nr:prepilin-type N-terminal cleavage/methylation domain-containing protein [Tepidisphaeraceae bacterium]